MSGNVPLTALGPLEIWATDVRRAIAFYQHVFEFEITSFADGTCWFSMPPLGGDHGVTAVIRTRTAEDDKIINTFRVASLVVVLARVLRHGGRVFVQRSPRAGGAFFAYCRDTEGNGFAIEQCGSINPDAGTHAERLTD